MAKTMLSNTRKPDDAMINGRRDPLDRIEDSVLGSLPSFEPFHKHRCKFSVSVQR
jgi:hypothetical protein